MKMTHGSLFSGIDGFGLAAEWVGWENVFTCEIDNFCNIILENNFKHEKRYKDIKTTDFSIWRGKIDVLSGGFPCQPYSQAGKRLGKEDERHLWPEMLRAIREISPRWVVGENVRGIINWDGGVVFDEVCSDLEALGYEVLPLLLPAAGVNAPHERYRVFFVAHADHPRASVKMRNNDRWEKDDQRWERFSQSEYRKNGSDGATPPTPSAQPMAYISPERAEQLGWEWRGIAYYRPDGSKVQTELSHQVGRMLPTPTAQDFKRRGPNSKQQGLPEAAHNGMLPTPQTQGLKTCNRNGKTEFMDLRMLPTPKVTDSRHALRDRGKSNLGEEMSELHFQQTGQTSQLNHRFVMEMMGFPPNYCDIAFEKIAWGYYLKKKSTKSFQAQLAVLEKKQSRQGEMP